MMKKWIIKILSLALCQVTLAEMREWKTADGIKRIEAEYIGAAGGKVTIKRKSDQRKFTIELTKLSKADQDWVAAKLATTPEAEVEKGPDPILAKLLTGKWEEHEAHAMKYRIFGARKMRKSKEKKYPLVIYLHGKGGDVMTPKEPWNANIFSSKSNYRKRPCIVIAPQCPDFGWNGKKAESVLSIVNDLVENFPIDERRIYITGYSMGSFGTFTLSRMRPKLFAGAVAVAGGTNPNHANKLKDIPIWVFHGDADDIVKVESSRNIVEAIKKLNGKIKYTEFRGASHGITAQVYGDKKVHEWLFDQQRE